ncbi:DUF938 domain-containing protein [Psychrobacter sp. GP33]|uniref:DUF938 domain-containing protein n=1 Tax=Psychrobacter sp. GP33 TaxID=2758709 RepID=UPI0015F895F7|nr:DUF938 domain-containing protein [Psychrobacter sp. GP33]
MSNDNLGNADVNASAALPFSQACENNKRPILAILQQELQAARHVLEIGSGTGQHSVYFAPQLAHLKWQTSDVSANHDIIKAWHEAYPAPNLYSPLIFDLAQNVLPFNPDIHQPYDAVFTANTLHIIDWSLVKNLFALTAQALPAHGKLIIYGPFNVQGKYTSAGNRRFDAMLRQRDSGSGIRDIEAIIELAETHQLTLKFNHDMPANNQLLVFEKLGFEKTV